MAASEVASVGLEVSSVGCVRGVAAVVYGGQRGPIAQVVVAGSMYPAVAIGLGWALLGQALNRRQVLGVGAALVGVALIASG